MSTADPLTIQQLIAQADDDTQPGNYFVSNYPPFFHWSLDNANDWNEQLSQSHDDRNLGLYLHIPFCRKRCHFCYFKVYTGKNASEINRYLDSMIEEAKTYAERNYLKDRSPHFIYFGGGTPSYLSPKQLQGLCKGIQELFPWDQAKEVAFECEPGTLNEDKLKAIYDLGVNRLSLGVENFDDHILDLNGRAHRSSEIYKAYETAMSLGFDHINIDLIAGMIDETEENWQRCIEETLRLEPHSVTIYQMEVPYNTTIYKGMKENGELKAPVASWLTKRRWVSEAFDALTSKGYHIGSAYTAVKDPEKHAFVYRDELWKGSDLLSLGVASFGHLGGVHSQNISNIEDYISQVESKQLPLQRILRPEKEQLFRREFLLQLKLGTLHFDYFREKFSEDPLKVFSTQLNELKALRLAEVTDSSITLTREALLRVDAILYAFFEPELQNTRYT